MNKLILAIGGAVIKTARYELKKFIEDGHVEMLIHNGGSIFHDFQLSVDDMDSHSYPLSELIKDYSVNENASAYVWGWIYAGSAPKDSVTRLCEDMGIPVLMFTGIACDYWQLFGCRSHWKKLGEYSFNNLNTLCNRFKKDNFHYVCMGSAVIHPEVFIKAISVAHPKNFIADVVDFKDMYRPRTRVAVYGTYYKMEHKEYLKYIGNI